MPYESILVGSGKIYVANVGVAFPTSPADAPSGSWTSLGEIDGGVTVNYNETVDAHRVDSEAGPLKGTRSIEDLMVAANLAEATLEILGKVLDDKTITGTNPKVMGVYRGIGVVKEYALLFRGSSPYANVAAQYELPRGIQQGNIGTPFTKDSKVLIPVEFMALVDPSAATLAEKFGRWKALTS